MGNMEMVKRRRPLAVMTAEEHNRLRVVLSHFEFLTLYVTGVRRISGGFAKAELQSYNGKSLLIRLKWGVQSDCENTVHVEKYRLQRAELNAKWSIGRSANALTDRLKSVVHKLKEC